MGCGNSRETTVSPRKTCMQPRDIEDVQNIWAIVAGQKEKFGVFVYNNFLSNEKEVRKLFPRLVMENGKEKFSVNELELRRHALLVMDGLGLAVECLKDVDKLRHFLHIVGVRHSRVGVKSEMMMKLYPATEDALRKLLGRNFNNRIRRAWRAFFDYIVDCMKTAMIQEERNACREQMKSMVK
ncbi:hypothetical protein V1264_018732 [Littorina saxatilis]|uniref:Globin n=1 Tax=Littorina saxatilis TaxID=31220 RepID=A0AAN9BDD9_9CAEN